MQPLHFALAHALDARAQFAQAAEHANQGNALQEERSKRGGQAYGSDGHRAFVDQLRTTFTPELFERCRGLGVESKLPVFIVGLPRSGTTLIEQVLASHSRVHAAGELTLATDCFDSLPTICGISGTPLDCIPGLDPKSAADVAARYLAGISCLGGGKARVTDKMPDNYLYVGFLHILFPNARIIHCRRDLRDIALSCWLTEFRSIRWASKQEHIVERIKEYLRITEHWRRVLPNRMLEIRYEETVENLQPVARRMLEWLGHRVGGPMPQVPRKPTSGSDREPGSSPRTRLPGLDCSLEELLSIHAKLLRQAAAFRLKFLVGSLVGCDQTGKQGRSMAKHQRCVPLLRGSH